MEPPKLIVHLKGGKTYVGDLVYYDSSLVTLAAGDKLIDLWVAEISHVLLSAEATS